MQNFNNIKAIIFDFDDTLVDSFHGCLIAYQELASEYGFKVTEEDLLKFWGKAGDEVIAGVLKNSESLENLKQKLFLKLRGSIPPKEGMKEIIDKLKEKYILGIITASTRDSLEGNYQIPILKMNEFKFIYTADDSEYHKPDPRVLDNAFKFLDSNYNIGKDEIVFIGDSLFDYLSAKGASIQFLAIVDGPTSKEKFIENGLDENFIIEKLAELKRFL